MEEDLDLDFEQEIPKHSEAALSVGKKKQIFKKEKAKSIKNRIQELKQQSKKLKKKNIEQKAEKKRIAKEIKTLKASLKASEELPNPNIKATNDLEEMIESMD